MEDFRKVSNLLRASRVEQGPFKIKASNASAKRGLQYEQRVFTALKAFVSEDKFFKIEHNPWFSFTDANGHNYCAPDILLHYKHSTVVIVEVKLTWVKEAEPKLEQLYCPVISLALDRLVAPLVICRNLIPEAPRPSFTFSEALDNPHRLLHWPATGTILW